MKKQIFLSLSSVLFFWGCANKDVVFTQTPLCQAPIATLSLQTITQTPSNTTLNKEEYKNILTQILEGTNCLTITEKGEQSSYALSATYGVDLSSKEQKETLSSQSTHTLNAKVTLIFTSQDEIIQQRGESTIQAQEKRILGLGEREEISREDEINALKNSTLIALKNFITSLQNKPSPSE